MPRQESRQSGTSNRGFASMDPELQRAIASKGGKAAHQSGNAHRFSSEEAREAGRKGGQAAHRSSASSRRSAEKESETQEEEGEAYEGKDQSLQGGANPQAGAGGGNPRYPEAGNEARGRGRRHDVNQDAMMRDYQAENQGRNQGRNNFSTDQERIARSGQGRDR